MVLISPKVHKNGLCGTVQAEMWAAPQQFSQLCLLWTTHKHRQRGGLKEELIHFNAAEHVSLSLNTFEYILSLYIYI